MASILNWVWMERLRLRLVFILFFMTQLAFCQLSNFTLTVTKTDETCTANGTLSFSVSNTTSGSTILYSIYLLPDTITPISVQSAGAISGLTAGTYRVVATQSLGNNSGTQQYDITIQNNIHPLTYQVSGVNEVCGNDGVITVTVTAGTAVNYEIFSGPMIRPLQTSNVFTGLTAGVYQIRVFDNCHEGVVRTFTVLHVDSALNFTLLAPHLASCTTVSVGANFSTVLPTPSGVVKYPIQVITTVYPPSGSPIIYNLTITSGSGFSQGISFYTNQPYNYSFTVTDGCGRVYNLNGIVQNLSTSASYMILPQDCTHKQVPFSNVSALTLVSAPTGYGGTIPQSFTSSIINNSVTVTDLTAGTYVFNATDVCGNLQVFTIEIVIVPIAPPYSFLSNVTCLTGTVYIYGIQELILTSCPSAYVVSLPHDYISLINSANYAVFVGLPIGTYVFDVVDLCGHPSTMVITIAPTSQSPIATVLEGCDTGFGTVQITGQFASIILTSAPSTYNVSLPADLTGTTILNGTNLSLDSLPAGNYVFQSTTACNVSYTTNVTILGYLESTNVIISPNCGSFNLNLNHTSNNNTHATFWLQKYSVITGQWGHPSTNVAYVPGTIPTTANSFPLTNNTIAYNLAFSGHFRILKIFDSYSPGTLSSLCFKDIDEFDFSGEPKINDVYSISCGSTFEVIVNAQGNSALIYRITTKDGLPFLIENGSSSIFSGLAPATYNFQIEDTCGNILNSLFQILSPNPLEITATSISCNGDSASLTVPNFAFLTYQWWKDNNTTAVLSTTNSLYFPSFNATTDNGMYHVRIIYTGNSNSCLNQVLDHTISITIATPHAGNDAALSYCGTQGTINLATLLTGTFDPAGTWSELTSSGTLTNNLWNSSTVQAGTYQFKYSVTGTCDLSDEALINVTIKPIPEIPTASVDPIVCESQNLNLFATTVANATYHWDGPNGFVSTVQNPILNSISPNQSGIYTVHASQNSCQSGDSSVNVVVSPLPSFVLNQDCVGKEYQLWITKLVDTSYDEATSTFHWTGPNNFTSNQSLITITGEQTGIYSLTITNQNGCEATNTIDVVRTICFIPNVITPNNDGTNESLDLAGFNVEKLEIYNRWGRKVYEKNGYIDEWHGQNMNGGILPDSTYYYIIKLGTAETKTGWIFLSRG